MTLRNCIMVQAHLESVFQVILDAPDLKSLIPILERSLDELRMVKLNLVDPAVKNVVPLAKRSDGNVRLPPLGPNIQVWLSGATRSQSDYPVTTAATGTYPDNRST